MSGFKTKSYVLKLADGSHHPILEKKVRLRLEARTFKFLDDAFKKANVNWNEFVAAAVLEKAERMVAEADALKKEAALEAGFPGLSAEDMKPVPPEMEAAFRNTPVEEILA